MARMCKPCPKCGGATRFVFIPNPRHGRPLWYCTQCKHTAPGNDDGAALPTTIAPRTPEETALAYVGYAAGADHCANLLQTPAGAEALRYLRERGLTDDTIRAARLGWHPITKPSYGLGIALYDSDRTAYDGARLGGLLGERGQERGCLQGCITIPYHADGQVVLMRGRKLRPSGKLKYLSPSGPMYAGGTPRLYGHEFLTHAPAVILTEGEFKALLATQAYVAKQLSIPAVAHPGVGYLPPAMIEPLAGKVVYLCYDNERRKAPCQPAPGEKFTLINGEKLVAAGLEVRVMVLPRAHHEEKTDLDGYLLAAGAEAAQRLIDDALPFAEWQRHHAASLGPVRAVRLDETLPQAPRGRVASALFEQEAGDAALLAYLYKDRLAYDHAAAAWFVWTGNCWQEDTGGMVRRLLAGQVAQQYITLAGVVNTEAAAESDPDRKTAKRKEADNLYERATRLRNLKRVRNVLELAQSWMGVSGEEWDRDPWLLGVANGVVDLRTGQLRPGHPTDYIRATSPTAWRGLDAPAPRWEKFIREIANEDELKAAFAQRLLGYGITGLDVEHILAILWGPQGRNGKDTLLGAISETLGPALAGPCAKDVLLDQGRGRAAGAAQPHLLDLRGKRLVWASETKEGERLDAAQVKEITGGGIVAARGLYQPRIARFPQTWTPLLMTNNRPHAPSDDDALWSRVILLSFLLRFVDKPTADNERQRDPHLKATLRREASGILAWLVRGCLAWQQQGLNPPESVLLATQEYREAEDPLTAFLEDFCRLEGQAPAGALYKAYCQWATINGIPHPMSSRKFGEAMGKRFEKIEDRNHSRHYVGVSLLNTPPPTEEERQAARDSAGVKEGAGGLRQESTREEVEIRESLCNDHPALSRTPAQQSKNGHPTHPHYPATHPHFNGTNGHHTTELEEGDL